MSRFMLPAVLLAAAVVTGCIDVGQPSSPVGPDASPVASTVPGQENETAALDELTRLVALSL